MAPAAPCLIASTQPPAIANAINRQWAADLAWNLTQHNSSSAYLPVTLMRLPHVKGREVWGPPSWQYGYQLHSPAEQRTMHIVKHLTYASCDGANTLLRPTPAAVASSAELWWLRGLPAISENANQPSSTTTAPAPPLVVEIGANEGAYGRVSSAYGCRVLSVEPQAACLRMLAFAVSMVPSQRTACLVHGFVSDTAFSMHVPAAPCSGVGTSKTSKHDESTTSGGSDVAIKAFGAPLQPLQPAAEAKARMQAESGYATSARDAVVRHELTEWCTAHASTLPTLSALPALSEPLSVSCTAHRSLDPLLSVRFHLSFTR